MEMKNNKMSIRKFMGLDIDEQMEIYYRLSWDLLIPVIEKIKENIPELETYQRDLYNSIMFHHQELDLDKTYQAVILYLQK